MAVQPLALTEGAHAEHPILLLRKPSAMTGDGPAAIGPAVGGPVPDGPVPDGPVPDGPVPDGPVPGSGRDLLKYRRVVALVHGRIADGTLRAGQPAPSGAELSRITGYSTLTCRKALRVLIADGILVPGPSRSARPRVAGGPQPKSERDLAEATRALSAGLAARRHAAGLTQPDLAALAGVSVTTIGHAETGRVWQSRSFWERADTTLGAGGDLLRLHDAYRAAGASRGGNRPASSDEPVAERNEERVARGLAACALAASGEATGPSGPQGPGGPSYVMIVWGNGTVTTVHPPDAR